MVSAFDFEAVLFVFEIYIIQTCVFFYAGEVVSNHDELMSNFFAQPDALAYGKVHSHPPSLPNSCFNINKSALGYHKAYLCFSICHL